MIIVGPNEPAAAGGNCGALSEEFDVGGCGFDRVAIAGWKAEALSTGTWCGDKKFRLADGTSSDNLETWILVQEPELVNLGFLFPYKREVIVGYHFKSLLTRDAATLAIQYAYGNSATGFENKFHRSFSEATAQGKCAGWHDHPTVGGLIEEGAASYLVHIAVSGAHVQIVKTENVQVSAEISASAEYQWQVSISKDGISVTTPKVSYGGKIAYQSSQGYSVFMESFTKEVALAAAVTGGSLINLNRLGATIPISPNGPALCIAAMVATEDENNDANGIEDCSPLYTGSDALQ